MMRMKTKLRGLSTANGGVSAGGGGGESDGGEWELRPGGMLVQKRNLEGNRTFAPPPTIKLRVKYMSTYHEIHISSQATFGELKKMLAGATGVHHQDQKLIYKDKERDSNVFLDMAGVKDKSKMVLVEDPISHEKRLLEMRRNAKMEKASKSISEISLEVDRLAGHVSALESVITKGGKVAEKDVLNLIELLMNQLLKLDGIMADGDAKLQRKMQVKRVQKYVETLDMMKIKISMPNGNGNHMPMQHQHKYSNGQKLAPILEHQPKHSNGHQLLPIHEQRARHSVEHSPNDNHHPNQQQPTTKHSASGAVVVTTQWETFDSNPGPLVPIPSTSSSTSTVDNSVHQPKFPWDFFD